VSGPVPTFSRDQEFAADAFAIRVAAAAGYDPRGLATFLARVDRAATSGSGANDGVARMTDGYEDSHPLTQDRVVRAGVLAEHDTTAHRVGHDTYLRAIDGMIMGDSPEQGYARGGVFIHPRAGFLFDIPDGFSIRNSPSAVVGAAADGTAFVLTSATPGVAATPYDYLTGTWTVGLPVSAVTPLEVHAHPAVAATAVLAGDQGDLDADFAVIGWSPSLVYRVLSVAPASDAADAAKRPHAILSGILESFRPVTPGDLARFPPFRLLVLVAKPGDTIAALAHRMRLPPGGLIDRAAPDGQTISDPEQQLRILNGWLPGDRIRPGQAFKIVE
jgi:predicted Zn-dependent protease